MGMNNSFTNPFRSPDDQFIFEYEQAKEHDRSIALQTNKRLHIWEKNRPIREGRLRSMCGADLLPTAICINPKVKTLITETGPKITLPTDKTRNKETRYDLIRKKRELFLMQMMINTKSTEIQKLEHYSQCHQDGLSYSQKMLQKDGQAFAKFVDKCRQEVKIATDKVDDKIKIKQRKIQEIQRLSEHKNTTLSAINKNIDNLNQALKYKMFIQKAGRKNLKKKKMTKKNGQQIEQQNSDQDSQQQEKKASTRKSQTIQLGGQGGITMPLHIQQIIEDSDDQMQIGFDNPEQMAELFNELQEHNLELIQNTQDLQHQIEQVKHQKESLVAHFQDQLKSLNENKDNMQDEILEERKSVEKLKYLIGKQVNNQAQEKIIKTLQDSIKKIFMDGKKTQARQDTLTMLTQIEKRANKFMTWMKGFEDKGEENRVRMEKKQKQIDRNNRAAKREQNLKMEQEREQQKLRQKTQKKAQQAAMSMQRGKKHAFRSEPPKIKKQDQEQVESDEDERDYRKYVINVE